MKIYTHSGYGSLDMDIHSGYGSLDVDIHSGYGSLDMDQWIWIFLDIDPFFGSGFNLNNDI